MSLRRKHEQSIIDGFFDQFKNFAEQNGRKLFRCSLDGQDTLTGADYLFTQTTWFALVEFKYEESDIAAEKTKPLRLELCQALDNVANRLRQHNSCHFIAWSSNSPRTVLLNIYRNEVCHQQLWGADSQLQLPQPDTAKRILADDFMVDFFQQKNNAGASFDEFNYYLKWLLQISGGNGNEDGDGELELLLCDSVDNRCVFHEFSSVRALKNWFDTHYQALTLNQKPRGPSLR